MNDRNPPKTVVDVSENRKKPEYAEIEAKARALVYRTLYVGWLNGNMVNPERIDEMIERVVRDMGY